MLTRLLDSLLVLFGVTTLVFFLLEAVPGDPVDVMLGEFAQVADRAAMRNALGLDRPLPERWWEFISGVLQGDLGQSLLKNRPVTDLLLERLPATLQLTLAAFGVVIAVAFPLGVLAASRQNHWPDHAIRFVSLAAISVPNFWLGPLLVLAFSIGLGWFPVSGKTGLDSVVLPALTLGLSMAAVTLRMVRNMLLEVLQQAFIRTALAKGQTTAVTLWRHALPNAMLPVLTLLGLQLGALLAGAVITEVVFAWPGVGTLLIDAIQQRDYPVVQGVVLFIACSYVVINALTDALVQRLDPRAQNA